MRIGGKKREERAGWCGCGATASRSESESDMSNSVYQTRSFNARERNKYMSWTNEMDSCLIKVLAEQAKKGYKVDNVLKSEAYNVTIAALNERFGQDMTKDHIKNRLKTMKKQYYVLREMLTHKGFKWDDVRKTVVAENWVWSKYIKAHPDAKALREKCFENYDDLCLIASNNKSKTNFSTGNTIDFTDEMEVGENATGSDFQVDEKQIKKMRWTEQMDRCLGQGLADQVKKGCKIDNFLPREAYDSVLSTLNEKFGPDMTRDHIRNRLKTWKRQYVVLMEILSHSDFKWDEAQKRIVASDLVWDDYIKNHPDAKHFRGRTVENLHDMRLIFGNDYLYRESESQIDALPSIISEYDTLRAHDTSQLHGLIGKDQSKYQTWTKEMDQYLGEILIEQVKQGAIIDLNLKSSLYTVAVIAMNEKFRLDLMKDHIKNRLRTWRRQYGILNDLISLGQFEWDETDKRVVGDDWAWDDYIKIHPDARVFRAKVVENYDTWCILFDNNSTTNNFLRDSDDSVSPYIDVLQTSIHTRDQLRNVRWTKAMDLYLGKLLVEQVKLGNKSKLDNKLKAVAYVAAVGSLNERFQLDLSKEHIKNRIKTWKRLYGMMRDILDHNQFEWDNKSKMVVANDTAWNDYIKMVPEARILHGRVIENFEDLCVIIGNDEPTESCSFGNDEVYVDLTLENEDFVFQDAVERDSLVFYEQTSIHDRGRPIMWTKEMDKYLMEILLEQAKIGNKLKDYKPIAYTTALAAMNLKFSVKLSIDTLKDRVKSWRKLYALVKELLSQDGFEWDSMQKMVVAEDVVWNEYVEMRPYAKQLRSKSIECYEMLCIVVGIEPPPDPWPLSYADANMPPYGQQQLFTDTDHLFPSDGTEESSEQTREQPSATSLPNKKRRRSDILFEMVSAIATNIGKIANAIAENTNSSSNSVPFDELFGAVQSMEGFDDDLILEACEYLASDTKRAKMFMGLNDRLRRKWLLKRFRP